MKLLFMNYDLIHIHLPNIIKKILRLKAGHLCLIDTLSSLFEFNFRMFIFYMTYTCIRIYVWIDFFYSFQLGSNHLISWGLWIFVSPATKVAKARHSDHRFRRRRRRLRREHLVNPNVKLFLNFYNFLKSYSIVMKF